MDSIIGINCDNVKCDFIDASVKLTEIDNWINKPCPKCGTVLLTQNQVDEMFDGINEGIGQALDAALLEEGITDEMLKSIKIPQSDIDEAMEILNLK